MSDPSRDGEIVVIGSINMDLVCRIPALPKAGETLLGAEFQTIPGGKGANQAVAAARLARTRRVHMIGRVGDDEYGQTLLAGLTRNDVQIDHVTTTPGVSSGIALVMVEAAGENAIVVIPGANHQLSPRDIDAADDLLTRASLAVMQLEVPLETVQYAIEKCRKLGVKIILDPAPAPVGGLPAGLFDVDVITPNQSESNLLLADASPRDGTAADREWAGKTLLAKGARQVVLKLGSDGAMLFGNDGCGKILPPFKVNVVDTTAAGDAFTAAMAVAWTEGQSLSDAVQFANAAGALCCTGFGAQPSLPTREAVDRLCSMAMNR